MAKDYPSFSDIHTFILFVGYPRSGHSLVGALLNAHPQAIVAHELDAVGRINANIGKEQLFKEIVDKEAAFRSTGSQWMGYSYQIASAKENQLTHIGDKRGGTTSKHLEEDHSSLDTIIAWGLQLKIIHVARNPYDCISTAIRKREAKQGRPFQSPDVVRKIDHFFRKAEVIGQLIAAKKYAVHTLQLEDLIGNTEEQLIQLLHFLDLPINDDHLENSQQLVWNTPRRPRFESPHWSAKHKAQVMEKMKAYSFFNNYTFDL